MTVNPKSPVLRAPFADVGGLVDYVAGEAVAREVEQKTSQLEAISYHNDDQGIPERSGLAAITALAGGPFWR